MLAGPYRKTGQIRVSPCIDWYWIYLFWILAGHVSKPYLQRIHVQYELDVWYVPSPRVQISNLAMGLPYSCVKCQVCITVNSLFYRGVPPNQVTWRREQLMLFRTYMKLFIMKCFLLIWGPRSVCNFLYSNLNFRFVCPQLLCNALCFLMLVVALMTGIR